MAQPYSARVLQMAIAQICHTIGWDSAKPHSIEVLVNVTESFLREITRHMVRCSELNNRSESNLDDLAYAFGQLGINMDELRSFADSVESVPLPFEVPRFPLDKNEQRGNDFIYPNPPSPVDDVVVVVVDSDTEVKNETDETEMVADEN